MGFFDKMQVKARKQESIYPMIARVHGSTPRYSDVKYTTIAKEGYAENFVFNRCLREIITAAVQGEWIHYKKKSDGELEEVANSPFVAVLNKPNALHSKAELIKRMICFYYIGGEAPLQKIQTNMSGIKELYSYRPDKVSYEFTSDIVNPYANIKYLAGAYQQIDPTSFTLWKNFNPLDEFDGLGHGMSALQCALKNGDLLNSFIDWNVSLLQNGAAPSGAWVTEESLDDDTFIRMDKQLTNKHVGTRNAGKTMLLEGGVQWIKMGENPKDMDWKEGKESTIVDICSAIGPDPILIGYGKYSTYNNKKEAKKDLYTSHVIPLMMDMAGMFTNFLGLPDGEMIQMDFSNVSVMQEDEAEKSNRINQAKDLTINEKRQLRGYDAIKGGDIVGDGVIIANGVAYMSTLLVEVGEDLPAKEGVGEGKGIDFSKY